MAHALEAPDDHRLWARLALNWVEAHTPEHAAKVLDRALLLAPTCPMLLWYRAGVFELLGQDDTARVTYLLLLEQGVDGLAAGECGLGRTLAEGLMSDCFHRLALLDEARGRTREASAWYAEHLASLGEGRHGVYTLDDALILDERRLREAIRLRRDERPGGEPHAVR